MPTLTFEQIHQRVTAHYTRTEPSAALTSLGTAASAVYALRTAMAALEPFERAEIASLIVSELDILPPPALPAEKDSRYCFFCTAEYAPNLFNCPTCPPTA